MKKYNEEIKAKYASASAAHKERSKEKEISPTRLCDERQPLIDSTRKIAQ
jgi:hypothetical protein